MNVKLQFLLHSMIKISHHSSTPTQNVTESSLALCLALCCKHQPLCQAVNIPDIRVTAAVSNLVIAFK